MKKHFMFTSESVTEGHPDKLCDQISDAIVDHFLRQDPCTHIIAESAVSTSVVFLSAMFDSDISVDFPNITRKVIDQIGYRHPDFNAKTCSIITSLKEMPREDSCRFNEQNLSDEEIESIVARDQVTVFGFACNQTPDLMPLPIWLAHKLARQLAQSRLQGALPYLTPDGKIQVGIEYIDRKPRRIHSITITTGHEKTTTLLPGKLKSDLMDMVIWPVFEDEALRLDNQTRIFVNPYEPFLVGGPSMHAGLTGRKTAIDTYGEYARHSGAALSGKDPSRIDRIGAYAARYAAKNIVAAGIADECEIQLSYTIGLARPASINVETFGTGKISDEALSSIVEQFFEFRPAGIMKQFNLRQLPALMQGGFYQKLAAYGHFGRTDILLPWEETDKVALLRDEANF